MIRWCLQAAREIWVFAQVRAAGSLSYEWDISAWDRMVLVRWIQLAAPAFAHVALTAMQMAEALGRLSRWPEKRS